MMDQEQSSLSPEAKQDNQRADSFYIVGIGASAGGLEALEDFFTNVPADSDMAFVVVQHLSPDFKSLMDELLARHTSIPIFRVEDTTQVKPNAIYLIPPRKNMILSYGKLLLTEQDMSGGLNLPIDMFFRSLAQDAGKRSIAVVLSGTGSDGSRGIQDVHDAGGLVVVQDIESSGFDGMPRNAIGTGVADVVTNPEQIPLCLVQYATDPLGFPRGERKIDEPMLPGSELTVIFRLFRSRYGIDFTLYRPNTINRRIERRMQLTHCADLADYVTMLESNVGELDALYRDLLVEVTHFFRDPRAFEKLRRDVIPEIVQKAKGPRAEIRVWVPGCATGEEAYSLAMLLDDCATQLELTPTIKVFATDAHRNSLETASSGIYSAEAITDVPENLRERYFDGYGNLYHVTRELRQMVIFAPHDITKDPPFTKIDLLSCRNVLIYLATSAQKRVLSLFHFGMKVDGVMMLGPSESVGDLTREFDTIDQHWRIFRKLRDVRLPDAKSIPMSPALTSVVKESPAHPGVMRLQGALAESTVLDDLLDRYVPPSFLVNEHHELVHSFGDARKLLVQPKGRPTFEVLKMVEGDLRMALSAALHRAGREKQRVVLQGVRVEFDSTPKIMQIIVEPYTKRNQNLLLICLEELKEPYPAPEPTAETFQAGDQAANRIVDLERELEFTKQSLQTTVEELESSNEELQSTNEELVASNEELQSTNEELHSVNEELYTVNGEHQRKIDELTQLTADMDNLLRSTEIGTIFLDRELKIRKFTPAITTAFNVLEQDVGRPIGQFAYHLDNPELLDDARQVVDTAKPVEREVFGRDAAAYLQRIQPYRTADGVTNGVVITFTDVSLLAEARGALRQSEEQLRLILDSVHEAICGLDMLGNCTFCNPECLRLLGYESEEQLLGRNMHDLIHHTRPDGSPYPNQDCRIYKAFRQGRGVHVNDEVLWRADGTSFPAEYWSYPIRRDEVVIGAVMTFFDTTEWEEQKRSVWHLAALVESADDAIIGNSLDGTITSWNRAAERLYEYSAEEAVGQRISLIIPRDRDEEYEAILARITRGERVLHHETVRVAKGNRPVDISLSVSPIMDTTGLVVGASTIARDIASSKQERDHLQRVTRDLQDFAYAVSHDLHAPPRHILESSRVLSDECGETLSEPADSALKGITANAELLTERLDCLLDYSRVNTRGKPFQPTDVDELLDQVLERLDAKVTSSVATVTRGKLPVVSADRVQLSAVLEHLIDNALKYRGDNPPQIHIDARKNGGHWKFSVQDNGIGIDPKYFDRIFVIFNRLHSDEKIPGMGDGLAVSKRIIERHGGELTVDSTVDQGSTFSFTLPVVDE